MSQTSPQQQETLENARALIQEKKYREARQLLRMLPDHPIAQQWMAKLAEIAPETPLISTTPKRKKRSVDELMGKDLNAYHEKPFPPLRVPNEWRGQGSFLGYINALADNWQRYGKSEWRFFTYFLVYVFPFILAGVAGFFATFSVRNPDNRFFSSGVIILAIWFLTHSLAAIISVIYLQWTGYENWLLHKDLSELEQFRYPVLPAGLLYAFLVGVPIGAGLVWNITSFHQNTTYDMGAYTLEIGNTWVKHALNSEIDVNDACDAPPFTCQALFVARRNSAAEHIYIRSAGLFPYDASNLADFNGLQWQTISQSLNTQAIRHYPARVDGQQGFVHEWITQNRYYLSFYFVTEANIHAIHFAYTDREAWERQKAANTEILGTIQFK